MSAQETEPLLTPAEVATMFRVDPKTVTRWAKAGKLTSKRTPGGHRRYSEKEVRALLEGPEPDGLDAPVTTLWAAIITGPDASARKKLAAARIVTLAELVALDAAGLADIGIKGAALDAVRLVLAKRGLALHGEVLGKVALRGTRHPPLPDSGATGEIGAGSPHPHSQSFTPGGTSRSGGQAKRWATSRVLACPLMNRFG